MISVELERTHPDGTPERAEIYLDRNGSAPTVALHFFAGEDRYAGGIDYYGGRYIDALQYFYAEVGKLVVDGWEPTKRRFS